MLEKNIILTYVYIHVHYYYVTFLGSNCLNAILPMF